MKSKYFLLLIILVTILASVVSAQKVGAGTEDNSIKYIVGSVTLNQKTALAPEKIVKYQEDYDAYKVYLELVENTNTCVENCSGTLLVSVNNEVKFGSIKPNFYVDSTQKESSDKITAYKISVWDYTKKTWTTPETLPAGEYLLKLDGTKKDNVDVEWTISIPQETSDAVVTTESKQFSLWKKGPEVAQANLVAGFHLNEASGNITDFSGYGNNGNSLLFAGSYNVPAIFASGISETAGNFSIPDSASLHWGSNNFSVSFWIKSLSTNKASEHDVFIKANDTASYLNLYTTSNGYVLFYLQNLSGSSLSATGDTNILDMSWHHVLVNFYRPSGLDIYVDGRLNSHTAGSGGVLGSITNYAPILIGSAKGGYGPLNSTIDELLFFSQTQDATSLYESGITQMNITYPVNGTTYAYGSNIGGFAIVGFGDNSTTNITITSNASGSFVPVWWNMANVGNANEYATRVNATHVNVTFNYNNMVSGNYNATIVCYGGNAYQTTATQKIFWTIDTTTTTVTTMTTTTVTTMTTTTVTTTTTTTVTITSTTTTIATSGGVSVWDPQNILQQIMQGIEDWLMMSNDKDMCQVQVSNSSLFSYVNVNRHTYYYSYTYDEYLPVGQYFWRARCRHNQDFGMWSDITNFTHTAGPITLSWTVL